MTRLALLAVLLLALAPSVSRALSAGSTQVLAGWSELCTTMGLQLLPSPARSLSGEPAPAPVNGDYCDYCPLAASLPLVLLALALLLLAWPQGGRLSLPPAPRLRMAANLRGLGSRGPPILL
ncbi:hypothetical protein B1992_04415 [Pseudoxanthomonas broegbernensis]|uniref:DUF2946 domain-containing protein n=1 Tax=Pseudoxanthomonas broegbernensis TaxID=83619 RepID=A0A7V8GNP5_9GAMM|nr:DUF2946 family protein [Pseudoxanthomonas broegbernensis]KAF1687233.1 hypothetical protein B1992_04415 [Pseudoxanthomonas broegbernensis]MBB6065779.1 hypothetical protein [Pseudoxanthomonas broegbernensis]